MKIDMEGGFFFFLLTSIILYLLCIILLFQLILHFPLMSDAHTLDSKSINYLFRYAVGKKRGDSYLIIILTNTTPTWTLLYAS